MPPQATPKSRLVHSVLVLVILIAPIGCSAKRDETPPPTIAPAAAAISPVVTASPQGSVRPLAGVGEAIAFDAATSSAVVLDRDPAGATTLAVFPTTGPTRTIPLPSAATAIVGDGAGTVYLSATGGYLRVDVRGAGRVTRLDVEGQRAADFTAITRRADGKIVLGSADGAVFTLDSDTTVGARLQTFTRVDALAAQGNTVAVLDRSQTSVTTVDDTGTKQEHALRAGEGATTMVADAAGRILVADTRGQSLLVFGTDPLILRQQFPVAGAPYGLAGSRRLAWVSQTATNAVVGYDLATGIPVEKVRYRTVQQPNSLIYDAESNTLWVVSGSGAGVQVIPAAGR